jgi:hypothetical protein
MRFRFVLDQHAYLDCTVLAQWNNSSQIDMPSHSNTWFRANQSLLILLNDACLAEKQQVPILKYLVWPLSELELTIYRTRGEHANEYATDSVTFCFSFVIL